MKTKFSKRFSLVVFLALLFVAVIPVPADGGDGDDSIWDGVIDADGNILYDNLIDQGVYTEDVSWIPGVDMFGNTIGGTAEYHIQGL